MGERITPADRERLVHRQQMRIRTIVVSFSAAITSARRDLVLPVGERDALIESWRAWSLAVLERYGGEIARLREAGDLVTDRELELLDDTLSEAIDQVRSA